MNIQESFPTTIEISEKKTREIMIIGVLTFLTITAAAMLHVNQPEFILARLTTLTPKVIWATTTPVHPDRPFRNTEWAWRNEEIDQYNNVARELMTSRGIPINDLHMLVWSNGSEFLSEDPLQLSEVGQEACARAVVESISPLLTVR